MSRWNGALHKLLEIFQKVTRDFTKSCSKIAQETTKVAFCNETCSKVARKNQTFFGLMLKYANCTTKIRFLSILGQFCGLTSVAKQLCPQL